MASSAVGSAGNIGPDFARLKRLYDALHSINQIVIRSKTPDQLLADVCRAAVAEGGFQIAWVGWHEEPNRRIVPVAQFGDHDGFLENISVSSDDQPQGRGPTGIAMKTGKTVICNDYLADPSTLFWHERAKRRGIRASAAFPIRLFKKVRGVITIYAPEAGYFQSEEIKLLQGTADDVSFALENFEVQKEREQAEVMARRLTAIVESTNDAILSTCLAGNITSWNPAAEKIFGYAAHEVIGRHLSILIPDDRSDEDTKNLVRIMSGENIVDFETVRVAKDGRRIPVSLTMSPLRSSKGDIEGASRILRDITLRKRTEAALRETEIQLGTIIDNLDDALIIFNLNGVVMKWNAAAVRLYGYDDETKFPKSIDEFSKLIDLEGMDGRPLPLDQWPLPTLLRDEVLHDFEARVRHKSGEWERVLSYSGAVIAYGGKKKFAFIQIHDVTDRRKAEQAIRQSEASLRNAQRIAKLGSWEWYVQTDDLRWSSQLFDTFNIRKDDFEGNYHAFISRVHPDDRAAMNAVRDKILLTKCPLDFEHRIVTPRGVVKYLHLLGDITFDKNGEIECVHGTALDVTERHRAEEALRQSYAVLEQRVEERTLELEMEKDRAESADKLKSAFLATMSHELRTPLNSIIGFTGILLQGLAGPLNEEQDKQLRMVQGSARHLLALINDVLDLSKIEAGSLAIHMAPFDLRAAIEKAAGLVRPLAEKKKVELMVEIGNGVGTVESDQRRIEQVLLNLLHNAVKFTDRGEVRLTAELVAAESEGTTLDVDEPRISLTVRDTGIGITPDDLSLLFQPFHQVDTGLTRRHEGTGLGLAICKRLAEMLGAQISATSEYGKGSCFTLLLPVHSRVSP